MEVASTWAQGHLGWKTCFMLFCVEGMDAVWSEPKTKRTIHTVISNKSKSQSLWWHAYVLAPSDQ